MDSLSPKLNYALKNTAGINFEISAVFSIFMGDISRDKYMNK